jgi:hypothetical protein
MLRFPLALVLWCLIVQGAAAQSFQGSVTLQGRNVPLPPGTWQKVAEETVPSTIQGAPTNGMILNVMLIRAEAGRVLGMVHVSTNREPSVTFSGWATFSECSRSDIHAVRAASNTPRQQDCWTLNHGVMVRGNNANPFVNRYFDAAASLGGMPPTMLRVTCRRADTLNYLTVQYYFAPEAAGFAPSREPWNTSPWHRDRLDDARRTYVQRLVAWAPAAQAAVGRGFRGDAVQALAAP